MTFCTATDPLDCSANLAGSYRHARTLLGSLAAVSFAVSSHAGICQPVLQGALRPASALVLPAALLPPATALMLLPKTLMLPASALMLPASGSPRPGSQAHSPGYLGIEFRDLTDEQAAGLHIRGHGVEIVMVDHDGPAGAAGLRPEDIILNLNGQPVSSAEALRRMIHDQGAGAGIVLTVLRRGGPLTVNAQLADRGDVERAALARIPPDPPQANGPIISTFAGNATAEPAPPAATHGQSFLSTVLHLAPFTGLELSVMEPQLAVFFGAPQGQGLLVQTVVADSPAEAAGLHAGDVILRADGVALHSAADWTRHLHASKENPITLLVLRDRHEVTLTLKPQLKHRSLLEAPPLGIWDCILCA